MNCNYNNKLSQKLILQAYQRYNDPIKKQLPSHLATFLPGKTVNPFKLQTFNEILYLHRRIHSTYKTRSFVVYHHKNTTNNEVGPITIFHLSKFVQFLSLVTKKHVKAKRRITSPFYSDTTKRHKRRIKTRLSKSKQKNQQLCAYK